MSLSFVVQGAKLKCNFGDRESEYQVPIHHRDFINDKPQGNIKDHLPMVNIQPFGMCSSLANPVVAAATAANHGKLKKMPCIPATCVPWMNGRLDCWSENFPTVMSNSTLVCMWGGKIEVVEDGQ